MKYEWHDMEMHERASSIFPALRFVAFLSVRLVFVHGHNNVRNQHHVCQERSRGSGVRRVACAWVSGQMSGSERVDDQTRL